MTDDSRPASLQVADTLRAEIASGKLAPGDRLPSIRKLAERFGVAPMTAQSATEILRSAGLVYTSPGRGTFVRTNAETTDASTPSPEYLAITEHLDELDAQVHAIADRLNKLEELARQGNQDQL